MIGEASQLTSVTGGRHLPVLGLITLLVSLAGCESGFRIGAWQVIMPSEPLYATRIEVHRGVVLVAADEKETPSSRLAVDLVSGRASLVPEGGRAHPIEIDPDMLESLRSGIADRSWQVRAIGPAKQLARALVYEMTIFVGETEVKPSVRWHMPAAREVPTSLAQVSLVFNDAVRSVDPPSNRFDLLEE